MAEREATRRSQVAGRETARRQSMKKAPIKRDLVRMEFSDCWGVMRFDGSQKAMCRD